MKKLLPLLFVLLQCQAVTTLAKTIYVKPTGNASLSGTSWAKATSLKHALALSVPGDEIWVSGGTYPLDTCRFKAGVMGLGGFTGNETLRIKRNITQNPTILQGNQTQPVVTFEPNARPENTLVDGFIVQNGTHGFALNATSPTISNCLIRNNQVVGNGAGILIERGQAVDAPTPVLYANTFEKNLVSSSGWGTQDGAGGAVCIIGSNPILRSNLFRTNMAQYGGAIAVLQDSAPVIEQSTVFANTAQQTGGGLFVWKSNASNLCRIESNFFIKNISAQGSALFAFESATRLINNTITQNVANSAGSVLLRGALMNTTIKNNIIADNKNGGIDVSGNYTLLHNCIFGNSLYNYASGVRKGTKDIEVNPLFVDAKNGNFHLTDKSPCRDQGQNDLVESEVDIDSEARIDGSTVDIGADEVVPHLKSLSASPSSVVGGTTSDVIVTLDRSASKGGNTILLQSSDNSVLTLPQSLIIPAGAFVGKVKATGKFVAADKKVKVQATLGADVLTTTLTVKPWIAQVKLAPVSIVGGDDTSLLEVILNIPAQKGGLTVEIANSHYKVVNAPKSLTVLEKKTSIQARLTTSEIAQDTSVKLTLTHKLQKVVVTLLVKKPRPVRSIITVPDVEGEINDTVELAGEHSTTSGVAIAGSRLTFDVDGKRIGEAITGKDGKAVLPYKLERPAGTRKLVVRFAGNRRFLGTSGEGKVVVLPHPVGLEIEPIEDTPHNRPVKVKGSAKSVVNGVEAPLFAGAKIKVSIKELPSISTTTLVDQEGNYTTELPAPKTLGSYTVVAEYAGNDEFAPASAETGVNIVKAESLVTHSAPQTVKAGQSFDWSARVTDVFGNIHQNRWVNFKMDDAVIAGGNTNLQGVAPMTTIAPMVKGTYSLSAATDEDNNFMAGESEPSSLEVIGINTVLSGDAITAIIGQTIQVRRVLKDEYGNPLAGKQVSLSLDGGDAIVAITDQDGLATASFYLPLGGGAGVKTITSSFDGDDTYEASALETTVDVRPSPTILTAISVCGEIGQGVELGGRLTLLDGTPVANYTTTISGREVTTDGNGEFRFGYTIPGRAAGAYGHTLRFEGDDNLLGSEASYTVEVLYTATVLNVPDVEGRAGTRVTLWATLKRRHDGAPIAGRWVTFYLKHDRPNGYFETEPNSKDQTNSEGKANVNNVFLHSSWKKSSRNIKVIFQSDDRYQGAEGIGTLKTN